MRLHRHGDPHISGALLRDGVFEPEETEILKTLLHPGMTFVDVGANIGYYSILGSRLVGHGGAVIAFEPAPSNLALLNDNVRMNRCANVSVHEVALGNGNNVSTALFLSTDNQGDHRIAQVGPDETPRRTISVPSTTMDTVLNGVTVSVMKMDTQGAEAQIIAGAKETFRRTRALAVLTEFWPMGLRRANSDPEEYLRYFIDSGFSVHLINDCMVQPPLASHGLMRPIAAEELLAYFTPERAEYHVNLLMQRSP